MAEPDPLPAMGYELPLVKIQLVLLPASVLVPFDAFHVAPPVAVMAWMLV